MRATSPPESKHALDLEGLRKPDVTFWAAWVGETLAGCGALKELDSTHGEIKSMRVARSHRGQGVGAAIVQHLISEGVRRGYQRLSLETGSMAFFEPAHRLYQRFGFEFTGPFGNYRVDPNSCFMTRAMQ